MYSNINRWTPENQTNEDDPLLDYTQSNIKNLKLPFLSCSQSIPRLRNSLQGLKKNTSYCFKPKTSFGIVKIPSVHEYRFETGAGINKKVMKDTLKLKPVNIMPFSTNGTHKKKKVVVKKKFVSLCGSFLYHNKKID